MQCWGAKFSFVDQSPERCIYIIALIYIMIYIYYLSIITIGYSDSLTREVAERMRLINLQRSQNNNQVIILNTEYYTGNNSYQRRIRLSSVHFA